MRAILLSGTIILLGLGCKQAIIHAPVKEASVAKVSTVPEDFRVFYDQFHTDTVFQIGHILFPLSGLPANADTLSEPGNFRWQETNWKWHRLLDPTLAGYDRQWEILSDDLIVETIVQQASRIGMIRRFAKMDKGWMLIYYAGMNPTE